MTSARPLVLALALALGTGAASAQVATPQAAAEAMLAAVAARDAAAIAALYAPSAAVFAPGRPIMTGRDAIRADWEQSFRAGYSGLSFRHIVTDVGSDRAVLFVRWDAQINQGNGQMATLQGRSLMTLALRPGGWLIIADMWQPDG